MFRGEYGSIIDIQVNGLDLGSVASATLRFERPDKTVFDRTPIRYGQNYRYVLQVGDIGVNGNWRMQLIFTLKDGSPRLGSAMMFNVEDAL